MADATALAVDPPPPTGEFCSGESIPPSDVAYFSQNSDDFICKENQNGVVAMDDLDFDFSFDDVCMPSSADLNDLLNPTNFPQPNYELELQSNFAQFASNFDRLDGVIKSKCPELRHFGDGGCSGDNSWDSSGVLDPASPGTDCHQISGYLNVPSPESNELDLCSTENCSSGAKEFNCPSPESQGSASKYSDKCAGRLVNSSPNSSNSSNLNGVVDQKVKLEESINNDDRKSSLKRKKESGDLMMSNSDSVTNKFRKSNCSIENYSSSIDINGLGEEDEKRKVRLMRNRESAQLSRQRKKHYIEELEGKVRAMHSTIQDLNAKISYFMSENATLRQQVGGVGGVAAPTAPMVPPLPGMYPHPAGVMYPWMPCAPPYMMKTPGSHVPLVPIPRLKQQQAPKENKKVKSKEGQKMKKVAGISFLGLIFFILLFGGLAPMFNMRYGVKETFMGREAYSGDGFYEKRHERVLMVNGTEYGEKHGSRKDFSTSSACHGQTGSGRESRADEFVPLRNGSEPLAASLYVPRNDKLVKIDGNLIIHSVLASEKAMASHGKGGGQTGLAVPGDLVPAIPGNTHPSALGSGLVDKDGWKSAATDGRLQQWFREGHAGPMLNAGMCTEVFQFDVSAAIVPATPKPRNVSEKHNQNSTQVKKGKNRRILRSVPIPELPRNISTEHLGNTESRNKNESSMVVSVMFDPREAGDSNGDSVMGTKSISRVFVVVLIDSVRYVTYSCMLPFKGVATHLVTA